MSFLEFKRGPMLSWTRGLTLKQVEVVRKTGVGRAELFEQPEDLLRL